MDVQTYSRTALLCCTRAGLPGGLNEIVLIRCSDRWVPSSRLTLWRCGCSGSSDPALRSPEYEPEAWEGAVALRKVAGL